MLRNKKRRRSWDWQARRTRRRLTGAMATKQRMAIRDVIARFVVSKNRTGSACCSKQERGAVAGRVHVLRGEGEYLGKYLHTSRVQAVGMTSQLSRISLDPSADRRKKEEGSCSDHRSCISDAVQLFVASSHPPPPMPPDPRFLSSGPASFLSQQSRFYGRAGWSLGWLLTGPNVVCAVPIFLASIERHHPSPTSTTSANLSYLNRQPRVPI